MHNTIAFCEEGAVETEEPIAGVRDQNARVVGDDIYIGKYNHIISMFGGGSRAQTLRIVSPSLRGLFAPYIHPYMAEEAGAHWVVKPVYMLENPIALATNEALNVLIRCSEHSTEVDNWAGISLAEGPVAPVRGDIRTMVIEGIAAQTQKTWTNNTLTFPIDLPVGRYQVVGAMCRCTYPGIFRLVPVGEAYRPGGMVDATSKIVDCTGQRMGKMGVWCEFDQLTPPSLEVCLNRTGTWYSLKLDLIKVS